MARLPVPGPKVIPGVVEVKLYWSNGSHTFSNVLHGYHGGTTAINDTLAESVFTTLKSGMTTSGWQAMVHNTVALYRVGVKDMSTAYSPEYLSSGAALAGTGALKPIGDHTCIVFTQQTNKSGAQWRGRTYLGGLDSITTDDGRVCTEDAKNAAGSFGESIRTGFGTNQIPLCVAQVALQAGQSASGADMPPRSANYVLVSRCIVTDTRLDTQRRRLGR